MCLQFMVLLCPQSCAEYLINLYWYIETIKLIVISRKIVAVLQVDTKNPALFHLYLPEYVGYTEGTLKYMGNQCGTYL